MRRPTRATMLTLALLHCGAPRPPADAGPDGAALTDGGGAQDSTATGSESGPGADGGDTRGVVLEHTAGPWMAAAGQELSSDCESWTLDNEEPLYVNSVEMTATPGMHHSNWYFVPQAYFGGPDGTWRCSSRDFDQGFASTLGGVFFAHSTQTTSETQRFPPGTAIVLPPHTRIVGQIHVVNASAQPRAVSMTLRVRTLPRSEVRTRLSPFYLEYAPLDIAPRTRTDHVTECDLDARSRTALGRPLDLRFYYGLAHYHELGARMTVTILGGPLDGRVLYNTDARQGDSWARTMDPPVDLTGATGLRLSCAFDNPRAQRVGYGIGDQEMCIWFGFTDSTHQWAARAGSPAVNARTEQQDGGVVRRADCSELFTARSQWMGL